MVKHCSFREEKFIFIFLRIIQMNINNKIQMFHFLTLKEIMSSILFMKYIIFEKPPNPV